MRAALLLPFLLGACTLALDFKGVQQPCNAQNGCSSGFSCQDGKCVPGTAAECNAACDASGICFDKSCNRELVVVQSNNGVLTAEAPDFSCAGSDAGFNTPIHIQGCIEPLPAGSSTENAGGGGLTFYSGVKQTDLGSIEAPTSLDGGVVDCLSQTAYGTNVVGEDGVPRGIYLRSLYTPAADAGFLYTLTERIQVPPEVTSYSVPVAVVSRSFANTVRNGVGLNETPSTLVVGFVRDCKGRPLANARVAITGEGGTVPRYHYYAGLDRVDAVTLFDRTDRVVTGPTGFFIGAGLPKGGATIIATGLVNGAPYSVGSWDFYLPEQSAAAVVPISP